MTTDARGGQAADAAGAVQETPVPDFPWMRVPTQRGPKPVVGPQGLRLRDVDQGAYGYVPDQWPHRNDLPRGAVPGGVTFLEAGYSLYAKDEVWSENAADLYEDAIRDRWSSATDIPWEALQTYPEITERALCQILTEISEASLVCTQQFAGWLERISYGFYEVKSFLATQIYDSGRHHEALRKRALANGGGLGVESTGIYHRAVTSAMRLTEMVIAQNIVRDIWHVVVLDALRGVVNNDADRKLLDLVIQDLQRHIAYGIGHVNFYVMRNPDKLEQIHAWLGRAELLLAADVNHDKPFNEALILVLGDTVADGKLKLEALRRDFVAAYLHRLHDALVYDRIDKLVPPLKAYAPAGVGTQNSATMALPVADPLGSPA